MIKICSNLISLSSHLLDSKDIVGIMNLMNSILVTFPSMAEPTSTLSSEIMWALSVYTRNENLGTQTQEERILHFYNSDALFKCYLKNTHSNKAELIRLFLRVTGNFLSCTGYIDTILIKYEVVLNRIQ